MDDLPGPRTFTAREKLECIEREIKLRRYVYRNRVAKKQLKPETAEREIATMEAIADDYRRKQ